MKIGILGSGQLGRMLAHAAINLGHQVLFYDLTSGTPTEEFQSTTVGKFDDITALQEFAEQCDVVTYEFENIPTETVAIMQQYTHVHPSDKALAVCQDRLLEKEFLQSLGIGTPRFRSATTLDELEEGCASVGFPCVIKTRRFGYDGKGQIKVSQASEVAQAWQTLHSKALIIEGYVPFSRELSIIGTRDTQGKVVTYPLIENTHVDGILHRSEIPAPAVSSDIEKRAKEMMERVLNSLEYVGTIAIELFDVRGEILANEIAPRVHNSGHATIESTVTSQFENHIRAITGADMGGTNPIARAIMYNIIGDIPHMEEIQPWQSSFIHLYNKAPRPGRKLGHITLLNPSESEERSVAELCNR
jgi:5-(carboxyamino)imidazole ribonucleotide synthase